MTTKPFSVRFSESITKLVQGLSDRGNKTPSDFIREAVEEKLRRSSDHNKQVAMLEMDPEKAISGIRAKLDNVGSNGVSKEISIAEIAVMMRFWHRAYSINHANNFVNPRYVLALMSVLKDFLQEAHKQNQGFDFHYSNSILGSLINANFDGYDYESAFDELKVDFLESRVTGLPEMLARITEHSSDKLDGFVPSVISRVFTKARLEELFPVAVRGACVANGYAPVASNMSEFLPEAARFKVGDLKFAIYPGSFTLLVEGGHHLYPLGSHSTLSLCACSEEDSYVKKIALHGGIIKRDRLTIELFRGDAIIHEDNGYRLFMAQKDFFELLDNIKQVFSNQRWGALLKRVRLLDGDF